MGLASTVVSSAIVRRPRAMAIGYEDFVLPVETWLRKPKTSARSAAWK
jgi:hypothetical protein